MRNELSDDLQRRAPQYLILSLFSMIIVAALVFLGLRWWLGLTGASVYPTLGTWVAIIASGGVGIAAHVAISNAIEAWRDKSTKWQSQAFFALLLAVSIALLDMNANYHGSPELARSLTASVDSLKMDFGSVESDKKRILQEIRAIETPYGWCSTHKRNRCNVGNTGSNCPNHRFIFKAKPKYGISRKKFMDDEARIKELKSSLTRLDNSIADQRSHLVGMHRTSVSEYEQEWKERSGNYQYLSIYCWLLVGLLSYQTYDFEADFSRGSSRGSNDSQSPEREKEASKNPNNSNNSASKTSQRGGYKKDSMGRIKAAVEAMRAEGTEAIRRYASMSPNKVAEAISKKCGLSTTTIRKKWIDERGNPFVRYDEV